MLWSEFLLFFFIPVALGIMHSSVPLLDLVHPHQSCLRRFWPGIRSYLPHLGSLFCRVLRDSGFQLLTENESDFGVKIRGHHHGLRASHPARFSPSTIASTIARLVACFAPGNPVPFQAS